MARKKKESIKICPICGTRTEPIKTWNLVSPLPDAKGRITITVMGSFECPKCKHRWRGVVSKLKVGGSSIEVETGRGKKKVAEEEVVREKPEIIELDLEDILSEEEE